MKSWYNIFRAGFSLTVLSVSLALLVGCGQQKTAPAQGGVKSTGSSQATPVQAKSYANGDKLYADLAKLPEAELSKRLLEGAQKEKVVRIYTTLDEQIIEKLKKEFESLYPGVKVEYISGKETDLTSRASSEFRAGRYFVDVLQITSGLYVLNKEFPFSNLYNIPILKSHPKSNYGGYWMSIAFNPIVTTYNTKMVKAEEAPRSWDELLDPKWKGKVALDVNPQQMVEALVATRGEAKAREYFKKLVGDNDAQVRKGHTNIGNQLVAGEFPVAAEQLIYYVETTKAKGAPVEWIAQDPIPINVSGMAIVNKAPDPYAAMLFARFYGTNVKASEIIAEEGRIAVHPDVKPAFPDLKKFSDPALQARFFSRSPENIGKYEKESKAIIKEIVEAKIK